MIRIPFGLRALSVVPSPASRVGVMPARGSTNSTRTGKERREVVGDTRKLLLVEILSQLG